MFLAGPCRVRIVLHPRKPKVRDRRRELRRLGIKDRYWNGKHGLGVCELARKSQWNGRTRREESVSRWSWIIFTAAALFTERWTADVGIFGDGEKSETTVGRKLRPRFYDTWRMRRQIQEEYSGEQCCVSEQRDCSRAARGSGALKCQEMQRCAVGGRREYASWHKELLKVIAHTAKPGIL